jgi:DNA-binding NtrC family response regulator
MASGREATRIISANGRAVARFVRACRLVMQTPDGIEHTHEMAESVLRAGAQPGNHLVIADEAVSRIHFEIVAEPNGFRLRDLGSTNGTFVDGTRIIDVYLKSGARIRAGRTQIAVEVLDREAEIPLDENDRFGPLIGKSAPMKELFAILRRAAATNATILVEGESGTGKELIAEAIHLGSPRAEQPFVVFDCASAPANLVESELFGHEKGAFTGAESRRLGRLEEADGGTLFIDEIGELPLELQPRLLRLVETRELRKLGAERARKVDVRIVAATNRDLAAEVNRGTFRHDLYYRLAVVRVAVPPLRARIEDVPLLVEHFVKRALADDPEAANEVLARISEETRLRLETFPWRGNVRELRNAIERMIVLGGSELLPDAGPVLANRPARATETPPFQDAKAEILARFEKEYFTALWSLCGGNVSEIARRACMERAHVRAYLRRHGISPVSGRG